MTAHGGALLIGFEAFIPPGSATADDHRTVDFGHAAGRADAGAWYLIRRADWRYVVHRISVAERGAGVPRVATRTIRPSPFAGEAAIYFGGYDANKAPAQDTAWIVRGKAATSVGRPP